MRIGIDRAIVITALVTLTGGCSSAKSGGGGSGSGGVRGSGGLVTAGGASGSGGLVGAGGASATGGQLGSGGVASSGGRSGAGGSSGVAGAVAGSPGAGGSGGASASGGVIDSGGSAFGAGGSVAGGTTGRDGSSGSGGAPSSNDAGASTDGPSATSFEPCPTSGTCKILPLGDSITAGAGADPGDGGGYRSELFKKAVEGNKHITFVGSLSSGPTTIAGQPFPKNHEGHIGWVITQVSGIATTSNALKDQPHIVLLFIGTNDEGYASSEAGASDRLAQLIDKIVAALPNSLLVVSSIYPFPGCKSTNYTPTQCAANVTTYDAAIPGLVKQRADAGKHILYVDMSMLDATTALSSDGVHPNATVGYPWMGDKWYGVVAPYLH